MRYALLLILLLPVLALADTTITVPVAQLHDTYLSENGPRARFGSEGSIRIADASGTTDKHTIIYPEGLDTMMVLDGAVVTATRLKLYGNNALASGDVAVFELLVAAQEGEAGAAANDSLHLKGGASWLERYVPSFSVDSSGLPSSYDSRDSSWMTRAFDQLCGNCWSYGTIDNVAISHNKWVRTWTTDYNTEDSTGADREAWAIAQAANQRYKEISGTGMVTVQTTVDTFVVWSAQGRDTIDLMFQFVGPVPCSLRVDTDSVGFVFEFQDINEDPSGGNITDTIWASFDSVEYSCLSATNVTEVYADVAVETDTLLMDAEYQTLVLRLANVNNSVDQADTIHVDSLRIWSAEVLLKVDQFYSSSGAARLSAYEVKKYAWEPDDVSWKYWDNSNYYNWGSPGCNLGTGVTYSFAQVTVCANPTGCTGGTPEDAMSYIRDDDWLTEEDNFPETGQDTMTCPTSYLDSASYCALPRLPWYGYMRRAYIPDGELKAGIYNLGPVSAEFRSYTGWPVISDCDGHSYDTSTGWGAHEVVVVGWDDDLIVDSDTGCWLIKETRGEGWGCDGFGWISYDSEPFKGGASTGQFHWPVLHDSDTLWDSNGAGSAGTDFDSDTLDIVAYVYDAYNTFSLGTSLVQGWIDGTTQQYGVLLKAKALNDWAVYNSTEAASNTPVLEIDVKFPVSKYGKGKYGKGKYGR